MQETQVQSLGGEDALEKETATHFIILVWEIPWTEEPGELQFMGVTKNWTQLRAREYMPVFNNLLPLDSVGLINFLLLQ